MGFSLEGFVVRPARFADANAETTNEAVSGVNRDHLVLSDISGYDLAPTGELVEPYADMFRASTLLRPTGGTDQYLLWVAVGGSLSLLENDAFAQTVSGSEAVTPSRGSISVDGGTYEDGTRTFIVVDPGDRQISSPYSMIIRRGDGVIYTAFSADFDPISDPITGTWVLTEAWVNANLGGGFSEDRGDAVISVSYVLAGVKFWWTRNDSRKTRFFWDAARSTWKPLPGGTPTNLGAVDPNTESYNLEPPPYQYAAGRYLPGDTGDASKYALVRAGAYPDSSADAVEVLVVPDATTESAVDWGVLGNPSAIVGETNGVLILNPAWSALEKGKTLWYNPEAYSEDATGVLASLVSLAKDTNWDHPVLSPVPEATERPFVRAGFRRHLLPVAVDADNDLPADPTTVPAGSFYWSRSTGKTCFSATDIGKADPTDPLYELDWLGTTLFYDGVSMTDTPVSVQAPAPVYDENGDPLVGEALGGLGVPGTGDLFIKRAESMPPPGTSGVLWVPDGSGVLPNLSAAPQTRVLGQGLVRQVEGIGDSFFFSDEFAYEVTEVVEWDTDIPVLKIRVPKNTAIVGRQFLNDLSNPYPIANASRVQIRRRPVNGAPLYWRQSQVTPSTWAREFRIYSRQTEPFAFPLRGTAAPEQMKFRIGSDVYVFSSGALPAPANGTDYTAEEIAQHLNTTVITGVGQAFAFRGRVVLEDPTDQAIEIGWNDDRYDFSGHAVLGFLPGWLVTSGIRWLPDNGASFGVFRSPENLDRTGTEPDFRDIYSIGRKRERGRELLTLTDNPFAPLDSPPLVDIPGFDIGVHFRTTSGLKRVRLKNYRTTRGFGVKYEFEENRLHWIEEGETSSTPVLSPTDNLQLENGGVLPESVSSAAMAPNGSGFGLYLKEPDALLSSELALGSGFLLPGDGGPGLAQLIEREGLQTYGAGRGVTVSGVFSNPVFSPDPLLNGKLQDAFYDAVEVGYLLEILQGDSQGVYEVTGKTKALGFTQLTLNPPPNEDEQGLSWRVFEAYLPDVYDPALVADVQLVEESPWVSEPWKIRVLTLLGDVPALGAADPSDALRRNRNCWVRFGLDQGTAVKQDQVYFLRRGLSVGTASSEMWLPEDEISNPHFTESVAGGGAYFQLRVGAIEFNTTVGNLAVVTGFTGDPNRIEVLSGATLLPGKIQVGSAVLGEISGQPVVYDELFRAPSSLAAGFCEVAPATGAVSLSAASATLYAGQAAYFVEELVVRSNLDAEINPIGGAFLLEKSTKEGQIVETAYWQADTNGDKNTDKDGNLIYKIEYLPNFVRLEQAVRVDARTYAFNPTGKTLTNIGEEQIWVGVQLQNYAGVITAVVGEDSLIRFSEDVPLDQAVQINYAVLESFGESEAYSVSTPPVYRKPVFLEKDQTQYVFEGNRTEDFLEGQLFLLGGAAFWIVGVDYALGTGTTVTLFPSIPVEAGSRQPAPTPEGTLLVSNLPLSLDYPDSPEGFWVEADPAITPLLPVSRGRTAVSFAGNLTEFAKNQHVLEIGGRPYIVVSGTLSEDGRFTNISLASPTQTAHDSSDLVRVSVRPVYPPDPSVFVTPKPVVPGEDFFLFLMGRRDSSGNLLPGKLLAQNTDYNLETASGEISFLYPNQPALAPWERLQTSVTYARTVSPEVVDGGVAAPVYRSKYLAEGSPSKKNGYLGSKLYARYSFSSPDAFYMEVPSLVDYLVEVGGVALSNSQATSRSTGPTLGGVSLEIGKQGGLGLRGEVQNYADQDRAARAYVEFFNQVVVAFEQVLEALDGRIIGDRDGKFKFFVGHGKTYAPPGWEDPITGEISPRLIWGEIIDNWAGGSWGGAYTKEDPVYDPSTAEAPYNDPGASPYRPGQTDGKTPDPDTLERFVLRQKRRIKNDMDDWILTGFGRPRGLAALFPSINVPGKFKQVWEDHPLSRLYPERAQHFSRLLPGVDARFGDYGITDPGFYTPGRKILIPGPRPGEQTEQDVRTRGTSIGKISNGVMDPITNIVSVTVSDRLPRARVWRYYPQGSLDLDNALGTTTYGYATIVATPVPLSEFPIDSDTGFPDLDQILYQVSPGVPSGGAVYSLDTGNPDLATPAFTAGQTLSWGKPDGDTYFLTDPQGKPVYAEEPQAGCVFRVTDATGAPLQGSAVLALDGVPLGNIAEEGDTVYVSPPTPDPDEIPGDEDNITPDTLSQMAGANSSYDIQKDLKVARRTGDFIDNSYRTKEDTFRLNIRGFLGQNPPAPLSCVEGQADFVNTENQPLEIPALQGLPLNDSGDNSIPYLQSRECEAVLLGDVADSITALVGADTSATLPLPVGWPAEEQQTWKAVYPDEVIVATGELLSLVDPGAGFDPATVYFDTDARPVETAGAYTNKSAIGDVRPYDLILVEADQPLVGSGEIPRGMTGILSVGRVTGWATNTSFSTLEAPRFVTPVSAGSLHRYTLTGAFGYVDGNSPPLAGMEYRETPSGPNFLTDFDFSSVPNMDLGDAPGSTTGGVLALIPGNALVIRLYDPATGAFLGAVTFTDTAVGPNCWAYPAGGPPVSVSLTTPLILSAADVLQVELGTALTGLIPGLVSVVGVFYEYSITLDTYIDAATESVTTPATQGTGAGSLTCGIERDRLTFFEEVNLQKMTQRGTVTTGASPEDISSSLAVWEVTLAAGAGSTVNAPSEVNGGQPFTFLDRAGPAPLYQNYVGEWGSVRVPAWEGHGNTPLPLLGGDVLNIKLSAIPSSDAGLSSEILSGTGKILDDVPLAGPGFDTLDGKNNWIQEVAVSAGSLDSPVAGDIVVVGADGDEAGYAKTGTYLVRHTIAPNGVGNTSGVALYEPSPADTVTPAGTRVFFDLTFPRLKAWDEGAGEITLTGVRSVGSPSLGGVGFANTGWVYVIRRAAYASYDGTNYTLDRESVVRADYTLTSYDPVTQELVMTLGGTYEDAEGTAYATPAEWFALLQENQAVSGMIHFEVMPDLAGLPDNNIVGYWEGSGVNPNGAVAGIWALAMRNNTSRVHGALSTADGFVWDRSSAATDIRRDLNGTSPGLPNDLSVRVPEGADGTAFLSDRMEPVYGRSFLSSSIFGPVQGVPRYVSTTQLTTAWDAIHFNSGAAVPTNVLRCLLPGDQIVVGNGHTPSTAQAGFVALSGVYLEPTLPRPVLDLAGAVERVVAASYAGLTATEVGVRQAGDYLPGATEETAPFRVRRIRRFHEVQAQISESAAGLRYLYETRRGQVAAGTTQYELVAASFNFDDFTGKGVNINAGDFVRILDADGNLVDEAEVLTDPDQALSLTLKRPGFTDAGFLGDPSSYFYEVWLQQPMVPLEQSNTQLWDLLVEGVVYQREVDYAGGDTLGGRVPRFNELQDDAPDAPATWGSAGVQEGDYVVVDAAGEFDPTGVEYKQGETGQRPRGDTAVLGRTPYNPGTGPSPLDDNRGFYRVVAVDEDRDGNPAPGVLVLDGGSRFSSGQEAPTEADDQKWGTTDPAPEGSYFALLPTVHGSLLTGDGREGQQALRTTAKAVDDGGVLSFAARTGLEGYSSIEPFGYRIVRTSNLFSQDSTELVLFMRERTLSWIEEISTLYNNSKGGDYYVFQRDDHIADIGSPTDPSSGPGIVSNYFVVDFTGLTDSTPFANTSDCLSVLDRRVFILDYRLDSLPSDPSVTPKYTSLSQDVWGQRPLLPDLVSEVLDLDDRFRAQRFSWVSFRAGRVNGSIRKARRSANQLPGELAKQRELVEQKKALKKS